MEKEKQLLRSSKQLIIVKAESWSSIHAKLQCFERKNTESNWKTVTGNFDVVIGKNGMAAGSQEFLPVNETNINLKKEGDNKAPAGIFSLGSSYGYSPKEEIANRIKIPYLQATEALKCVDDGNSKFYNQIVDIDKIIESELDWNSAEDMLRKDELYKWGIIVNYNTENPCKGCGSCIFIHIWRSPETGTEGCTAMPEDRIVELLKWLDPEKNPLLVQLPEKLYNEKRKDLNLP
jgi:zinc D-Ala-D-Ala dipeptidase